MTRNIGETRGAATEQLCDMENSKTANNIVDALKSLWSLYGNVRALRDLVEFGMPPNPWIAYCLESRPHLSLCRDLYLSDNDCFAKVIQPQKLGDAAASFGGKVEMLVFALFVVVPVCYNWNRRPDRAQVLVHAAAAAVWAAVTIARGWLVFARANVHVQHCVDLASAVAFGLLAIAMRSALPLPARDRAIVRVREVQEIQNDEVRNNSERIARLEESTAHNSKMLEDIVAMLSRPAAAGGIRLDSS